MNWYTNCSYLNGNGVTTVCHITYVFKKLCSKVTFSEMHLTAQILNYDDGREDQGREHFHAPILIENAPEIDDDDDDNEVVTEFMNKRFMVAV